ncbi:MAG: glutathione S-transferase family protein, partial [Betaproteobacteria bacterium]
MTTVVYGTSASGNCHKVRMVLDITGTPYAWREVDILQAGTRSPEFLRLNPNGKVPVVVLDDGTALAESNAILWYFGEGTRLIPTDRLGRAQMLQWMFFEQYTHEPAIAVARFLRVFLQKSDDPRLPELLARGHRALGVMEQHLATRDYFVGGQLSLA